MVFLWFPNISQAGPLLGTRRRARLPLLAAFQDGGAAAAGARRGGSQRAGAQGLRDLGPGPAEVRGDTGDGKWLP